MESRKNSDRQMRRANCFSAGERMKTRSPSVIVIGGGFGGISAARTLQDASFQVMVLESRDRIGGRVHTDYSFGFPVDLGASWLHGVCKENPLAPVIGRLGLPLYRTSGDNSVLYDHDLESYALFDMDGNQVNQELVTEVGVTFEQILEEINKVRDEQDADMSISQAFSIVFARKPELRLEGIAHNVLQWYLCRMEGWFAADAETISAKCWDQEELLPGGHGLMVRGYRPVINTLAKGLDIRLNHRVTKIVKIIKMNSKETKDDKDEKSNFYDTATKVIAIAGAVGAVAGLLSWMGSGSGSEDKGSEEKMMKAPGKDGFIPRKDFEDNPKDYFKDLRGKK